MSRLTMKRNSDGTVSQPCGMKWDDVLDKLTRYEDIADEPEKVVVLEKVLAVIDDYNLYKEDEDGDHIACKAEIMGEILALAEGDEK